MTAPTRQPSVLDALNIEHAREFSYAAHHSSAIDYLCLFRSAALTLKAYFFDRGQNDSVAVPHTHRYDFDTRVVAGALTEVRYRTRGSHGSWTSTRRFAYLPIVDGGGFTDAGEDRISEVSRALYRAGQTYSNRAHLDIHTLRDVSPGTILIITQYADDTDGHTYAWSCETPRTEGLYRRMSEREIRLRAEQLHAVLQSGGGHA